MMMMTVPTAKASSRGSFFGNTIKGAHLHRKAREREEPEFKLSVQMHSQFRIRSAPKSGRWLTTCFKMK